MKRTLLLLIAAAACLVALASGSYSPAPESLNYKVMFKWGLINKQAGSANLTLTNHDSVLHTRLTAKSAPWADRIFTVRDTLIGRMNRSLEPLYYEKIAHEGNEHKHDVVEFDYSRDGLVVGNCLRKVYKKGRLSVDETRSMEAPDKAVDMLTSFYYMRALPFGSMQPGEQVSVVIFSGKQKETLSMKYIGTEDITIDKNVHPTYHVRFTFTSKGGTKSSDDMDAWISSCPRRIPLMMEGKLPVGKVKCYYVSE